MGGMGKWCLSVSAVEGWKLTELAHEQEIIAAPETLGNSSATPLEELFAVNL